ncbi:PAS domain-containing sensor histidine kinase [Dehalogenimonas sp. 4OHTPN]|uniref:PAS domain-containing sensor histidine kinase n=1 Tax=Dehalogenimonas sp. 4OHTPN TaxID=3166643 RepID=A0AAU8GA27_9CHLR
MEKEARYQMLFDNSRDGIALIDAESGLIVDCNKEYQSLTGKTFEELIKMKVWETRPPDQQTAGEMVFREILKRGYGGANLDYVREDGYTVHTGFISRLITIDGKSYVQSLVRDDTERVNKEKELDQYRHRLEEMVQIRTRELTGIVEKLEASIQDSKSKQDQIIRFEHKLRNLTLEYVKAQESERRLLAAELHDRVVQDLVHICHYLSEVLEEATGSQKFQVDEVLQFVRSTLNETRNIMKSLYPVTLTRYGLIELIKQELRLLEDKTGLKVQMTGGLNTRLAPQIETALYRVFHEAILNIMKHSLTSTQVIVSVENSGGIVNLRVSDDGKGFDIDSILTGESGGIEGMRQRIELLGGTFKINSHLTQGTSIDVAVPLEPARWAESKDQERSAP